MGDEDDQLLDTAALEAETLRRARQGGRAENIQALELAVDGLFNGALSYQMAQFLAAGLEDAMRGQGGLSGASFERAFNLSRPKGAPALEEAAARNRRVSR